MIKVLGIDPGMIRLGFALVEKHEEDINIGPYALIAHPRDEKENYNPWINRGINQIVNEFPVLLSLTQPDIIVAETIPVGKLGSNSESAVAAITSCKVIAFQWGLPWRDIAARTVKKHFVGDGDATKARVRNKALAMYPSLQEKHNALKEQSREAGEKPLKGLEQDIFDAVAIASVGATMLHDNFSRSENKDS